MYRQTRVQTGVQTEVQTETEVQTRVQTGQTEKTISRLDNISPVRTLYMIRQHFHPWQALKCPINCCKYQLTSLSWPDCVQTHTEYTRIILLSLLYNKLIKVGWCSHKVWHSMGQEHPCIYFIKIVVDLMNNCLPDVKGNYYGTVSFVPHKTRFG